MLAAAWKPSESRRSRRCAAPTGPSATRRSATCTRCCCAPRASRSRAGAPRSRTCVARSSRTSRCAPEAASRARRGGRMTEPVLKRLLGPREQEIGCDECFERVDEYVESKLRGGAADRLVPGMNAHLQGCPACREEYYSLRALVA